jgi:acyl-CoA synthetase (AMP-forming)/AMP-acid ligase II
MTNLPLTFGEALARHATERPDQVAMRFEDRVTDYATFDRHATQIANGLLAMGLTKGDRVAYVRAWCWCR